MPHDDRGDGVTSGSARIHLVIQGAGGAAETRATSRRGAGWSAVLPLGGGLLAGSAAVALPQLVGGGDGGTDYRFVVAGALAAAGVAGLARNLRGGSRPAATAARLLIRRDSLAARNAPSPVPR
jgi:hypothetical protein